MELSKLKKQSLLSISLQFVGLFSIFFIFGCNNNSYLDKNYAIEIDSIKTKLNWENLFDYEGASLGILFVKDSLNNVYSVVLKDKKTFSIENINDEKDKIDIKLNEEIIGIGTDGNYFYCIPVYSKVIFKMAVLKSKKFSIEKIKIPAVFDSMYFISSSIHSSLIACENENFLIPYRAKNTAPDYIDTFSYFYIYKKNQTEIYFSKKIIRQLNKNVSNFEYFNKPLAIYNNLSNKIYYTFQNQDSIYALNLNTNATIAAKIPHFNYTNYDSAKTHDYTYLRKYISCSEINLKLFCDSIGNIYLIKKNNKEDLFKNRIICFDKSLKIIADIPIKEDLNPEISFLKNNKIYVRLQTSNDQLFTFHLFPKLQY